MVGEADMVAKVLIFFTSRKERFGRGGEKSTKVRYCIVFPFMYTRALRRKTGWCW